MRPRRQRTLPAEQPLGPWGEAYVQRHLEDRGFRLVARNLRVARIEIDLLMCHGRRYVVVEVKSSHAPTLPESNLSTRQLSRLRATLPILARTLSPRPRSLDLVLAALLVSPTESSTESSTGPSTELPTSTTELRFFDLLRDV